MTKEGEETIRLLIWEARISVGSSCQEGQNLALLSIALPAVV